LVIPRAPCWQPRGASGHRTALSISIVRSRLKIKLRKSGMLYTIAVILIVLWLLGLVSSYTMGGFIHVLLVIAIVVILVQLISGRRG
jgi:Family of unknown function (DUF5670)